MRFPRLIQSIAWVALVALGGCSSDSTCAVDADCFRGERCVDQRCGVPSNTGLPDMSAVSDDGGDLSLGSNDAEPTRDSDDRPDVMTPDGGANEPACIVNPFGNTCDDDSFEPNQDPIIFPPELFDPESWCNGTELTGSQTSDVLTLCAGDERDRFRLFIDNREPNDCITRQFTHRVEVHILTPCNPGDVVIDAELGALNQRCASGDGRFVCQWSDDGQTFTIDYLRPTEQLIDMHLDIAPAPGRDVQLDYEITVSVIL